MSHSNQKWHKFRGAGPTRLYPLAKANGISTKLELPSILDELEKQRLIDRSSSGVAILGLMDLGFSSAGYAISACLDIDPYSHVPKFLQLTPIV